MKKSEFTELTRASPTAADAHAAEVKFGEALAQTSDVADRKLLLLLLAGKITERAELARAEILKDAEKALQDLIAQDQGDALSYVSLSEHYLHFSKKPNLALATAIDATKRAAQMGSYFYQSHCQLCRAAIALRRFDVVENSLAEMTAHRHVADTVDSRPETDFIKIIPDGVIDTSILDAYLRMALPKPE